MSPGCGWDVRCLLQTTALPRAGSARDRTALRIVGGRGFEQRLEAAVRNINRSLRNMAPALLLASVVPAKAGIQRRQRRPLTLAVQMTMVACSGPPSTSRLLDASRPKDPRSRRVADFQPPNPIVRAGS
jgi:hypothetical protein